MVDGWIAGAIIPISYILAIILLEKLLFCSGLQKVVSVRINKSEANTQWKTAF